MKRLMDMQIGLTLLFSDYITQFETFGHFFNYSLENHNAFSCMLAKIAFTKPKINHIL